MSATTLQIVGAIDRCDPDPTCASDQLRSWIGVVTVMWAGGEKGAAILKVATGRGTGDALWGANALVLRWLGDAPDPDIAQSVYDVVQDGRPGRRQIRETVISQPRTAAQPSYRAIRVA